MCGHKRRGAGGIRHDARPIQTKLVGDTADHEASAVSNDPKNGVPIPMRRQNFAVLVPHATEVHTRLAHRGPGHVCEQKDSGGFPEQDPLLGVKLCRLLDGHLEVPRVKALDPAAVGREPTVGGPRHPRGGEVRLHIPPVIGGPRMGRARMHEAGRVRPAKRWNSERRVQDHDGGLFPVAAEGWGALQFFRAR